MMAPRINSMPLTPSQAWAASKAVRRADRGQLALRVVRPAGVGLARARGPLPLQLFLASRDGRLVGAGDSFALLEPPSARLAKRAAGSHRVLATVDQHWDLWVLGLPPFVLLALAFGVGVAGAPVGLLLSIIVVAVGYLLISMIGGVIGSLVWVARLGRAADGRGRDMAESRRAYHWSVSLLHHGPAEGVEDLTGQVAARVTNTVEQGLRDRARIDGARIGLVAVHQIVVLLTGGITSTATRDRLVEAAANHQLPYGPSGEVLLVLTGGRIEDVEPDPIIGGGGFLLLYLATVALAVAVCAVFVSAEEAARCAASSCAGRPSTWISAVNYLVHRLLLNDPARMSPASAGGTALGVLFSILGVTTVPVVYVAVRQEVRRFTSEREKWWSKINIVLEGSRALLLVVTEIERNAILAAASAHTKAPARVRFDASCTVYELGQIGNCDVVMVQAGQQGTVEEAAMPHTARTAIELLRPDYVLLVGICYGLQPAADVPAGRPSGYQHLGDVLISRRVQGLDHIAVRESDGQVRIVRRGPNVPASQILIDRCQAAESTWPHTDVAIHFGQLLSSNTLFDSRQAVDLLRAEFPDALGGEMEAIGVYTAASLQKVDWIMIKAICDWGHEKTPDHQETAAQHAADFVLHLLQVGALDGRRRGRPGGPA